MFNIFLLCYHVVHFDKSDFKCSIVDNSLVLGAENEPISTNLQNHVNIGQKATINSKEYTVTGLAKYAFTNTDITEIKLPSTINFIGEGCFYNCTKLKVISIINTNITIIEDYTFSNCYSLTNLFLPNILVSIGKYAFSSTSFPVLKPFPHSLKFIGEGAFFNCTTLLSLNFSNTQIKVFPNNVFRKCTKIVQIWYPPNLIIIRNHTFYGSGIIESDLPTTLREIGAYSFSNCIRLNSLNISHTQIKIIPESAFDQSTYLNSVLLPETVCEIQTNAFRSTLLETIYIPQSVSFIGKSAFAECTKLQTINLSAINIAILPTSLFENCASLTHIDFPSKLRMIDNYCLAGTNISTFVSPLTLETIGNKVFERSLNLKSVDISSPNLISLPPYTFYKCTHLKICKLPKSIQELDEGCFALCQSLTNFSFIGTNITTIGTKAFMKCENLKLVDFSHHITYIDDEAFHHCESLEMINLSHTNTTSIGASAFSNCLNLKAVLFPQTLKNIGEKAFDDTCISTIILPDSIKSFGSKSFSSCKELRTADLSKTTLTTISDQFVYSTALSQVSLPHTLRIIEDNAFSETSISTINLPTNLEKIGNNAFAGTRLTKISFNIIKIKYIGASAFTRTQLKFIGLPATITYLGDSCFESCSSLESANLAAAQLKYLPNRLFEDCKELETCILPLTLEILNTSVFSGTIIETLQIPYSVQKISSNAFKGMEKLTSLDYCGEFEFPNRIASLDEDVKIYVKKGYPYKTFAGLPTKTSINCPLIEENDHEPRIDPVEETNGSIVITTLTIGFIALAVVIVGIMKISTPRSHPHDDEVLLEDQEAQL